MNEREEKYVYHSSQIDKKYIILVDVITASLVLGISFIMSLLIEYMNYGTTKYYDFDEYSSFILMLIVLTLIVGTILGFYFVNNSDKSFIVIEKTKVSGRFYITNQIGNQRVSQMTYVDLDYKQITSIDQIGEGLMIHAQGTTYTIPRLYKLSEAYELVQKFYKSHL
ncbi:MAG: hypothetical protein IJV50_02390 [Lachnospiraceae bacterium]|nr:hypothetical protein [Lachnospiraceae bacterium]